MVATLQGVGSLSRIICPEVDFSCSFSHAEWGTVNKTLGVCKSNRADLQN
jgi:hypothetical protein